MRRILAVIIIILLECLPVIANTHKNYLYRNSFYVYDIDSFIHTPPDTFSIDVIYDIHFNNHNKYKKIQICNDNEVQFIIFNVMYNLKLNSYDTQYKGYVSGTWILEGMTRLFDNARIYYTNNLKLMPYYKKTVKQFKKYANNNSNNYYMNFPDDILEIFNAVESKSINDLDGLYDSLNTLHN